MRFRVFIGLQLLKVYCVTSCLLFILSYMNRGPLIFFFSYSLPNLKFGKIDASRYQDVASQ